MSASHFRRKSLQATMNEPLPPYASRLSALHRALDEDFRRIVNYLPREADDSVLDVGCGDGYFTGLLSEKGGSVTGVDNLEAYLVAARSHVKRENVDFIQGDARHLPFGDQSVEVVWSGHSMQSYPDVPQCLREFRRVLRPGGTLAVLETDNVHSVMLSWPPDLELAVRQAEHREIGDEDSYIGTYFPRFAKRLMEAAGFEQFDAHYIFVHRYGAASDSLAEFVRLYLNNLLETTRDHLSDRMKARLVVLSDPASEKFLPRQKAFSFGSLQVLMLAKVPLEKGKCEYEDQPNLIRCGRRSPEDPGA